MATKSQVVASFNALAALAEAIRELKTVPSGELYATVMGHMDERTYASFIDRLVSAELVSRSDSHLLTWVGPGPFTRRIATKH